MIEKKYTVIYADPPWKYKVWSGGGAADAHYPAMNLEDIKALPVSQLAAKDCALFLWITFPMLHEAWGVMKAWGFSFRTVAFGRGSGSIGAGLSPARAVLSLAYGTLDTRQRGDLLTCC